MTFGQLKTLVSQWLAIDQEDGDERLPEDVVGLIINLIAKDYLRRRESRLGEASVAFSTEPNTSDYSFPVGFSKPRKLWYIHPRTGKIVVLEYLDKDAFDIKYPLSSLLTIDGAGNLILQGGGNLILEGGGSLELSGAIDLTPGLGDPLEFTMWDERFVLGFCPNGLYTILCDYYKLYPDLSAPEDTNRFIEQAWEYLLFASLVKAAEFGADVSSERLALWAKEAKDFQDALDLEDTRRKTISRRPQSREPG